MKRILSILGQLALLLPISIVLDWKV